MNVRPVHDVFQTGGVCEYVSCGDSSIILFISLLLMLLLLLNRREAYKAMGGKGAGDTQSTFEHTSSTGNLLTHLVTRSLPSAQKSSSTSCATSGR